VPGHVCDWGSAFEPKLNVGDFRSSLTCLAAVGRLHSHFPFACLRKAAKCAMLAMRESCSPHEGTVHMFRTFRYGLATTFVAVGSAVGHAQAQNPLTITAPVSGQTVDRALSFSGTASVNTLTRRGTIRGKTNTGVECRGTTTANFTFSRGEGTLVCGQISVRFMFSLTRRQPPTGTGTGTLSDGRKVVLRIGQ
jgi:hypothetical protein